MPNLIDTSSFSPAWCAKGKPLVAVEPRRWRGSEIGRREFMVAIGALSFVARTRKVYARRGRGGEGGSSGNGFYPSTHWVPAQQPMVVAYPQPDASTPSYARHHWMYYDGVTAFNNVIPLFVVGGAYPHVWSIVSAPAGTTIGVAFTQTGVGYGEVVCAPTGNFTNATFHFRCTGQDGTSVDIVFTASTTSSTAHFPFANSATGSDTNSGTISSPFKTLTPLIGAAYGATTFPGATAVLMGSGTYAGFIQSGNLTGSMALDPSAGLGGIIGYPGDSPVIDITNVGGYCFTDAPSADGLFYQNLEFSGTNSAVCFHYIGSNNLNSQLTVHNIYCPNVFGGTNPTGTNAENASIVEVQDEGTTPRNYICMKGLKETNRSGTGSQKTWFCLFNANYSIGEFCTSTGRTNSGDISEAYKAGNSNCVLRYCSDITNLSAGVCALSIGAYPQGAPTAVNEICYCLLMNYGNLNGEQAFLINASANAMNDTYMYRNSAILLTGIWPALAANNGGSDTGNIYFINNAIQYPSTGSARVASGTGMTVTSSGTEAESTSSIFDSTNNYALTGVLASYNGIRGWLIQ